MPDPRQPDDTAILTALADPGRRPIAPRSPAQKRYVESMRAFELTFGIGPAGTGKTYLAMACAVAALMERRVKRIVLTRPALEAGERPLFDALGDMMDLDRARGLVTRGEIEIVPLAFLRGRTLSDSFVIFDDAQNATSEQMRMFLTRLGYESRVVVTGDVTQVDLPEGRTSGLLEARQLLAGVEGVAFCELTEADVVRHPLVQKVIVAYEQRDAREARPGGKAGPQIFPRPTEPPPTIPPISLMPPTVARPSAMDKGKGKS